PPAGRVSGPALYRGASPPGRAAVWLERGARAGTVIGHARRGVQFGASGLGCAGGGSDGRDRPAQEFAHGGGDRRGGGAAGRIAGNSLPVAGRAAAGVGGGLAAAGLGGGGRGGLGHLLAQQLVAAGERVLDVPPKLAARVRLLQAGDTSNNDPSDAFSVAVAALRSRARRDVTAEDHAAVLKIWAKRHRDLAR